jgi:hypothetical protein
MEILTKVLLKINHFSTKMMIRLKVYFLIKVKMLKMMGI